MSGGCVLCENYVCWPSISIAIDLSQECSWFSSSVFTLISQCLLFGVLPQAVVLCFALWLGLTNYSLCIIISTHYNNEKPRSQEVSILWASRSVSVVTPSLMTSFTCEGKKYIRKLWQDVIIEVHLAYVVISCHFDAYCLRSILLDFVFARTCCQTPRSHRPLTRMLNAWLKL